MGTHLMESASATLDLEVRFTTAPGEAAVVGTLVERGRRILFEDEPAWLGRAFELSPFTLSGRAGLIEHTHREFGPLPGLFDDSLPDGWGLLMNLGPAARPALDPARGRRPWPGARPRSVIVVRVRG